MSFRHSIVLLVQEQQLARGGKNILLGLWLRRTNCVFPLGKV